MNTKEESQQEGEFVSQLDERLLCLYGGPKPPVKLTSNWVSTSASKGWFVWFRFYGPTEPFFDKSWNLRDFEKIK